MKKLTAALLISALSASPALACSFQKNADHMMPSQSASMIPEQTQEAMSTFDPAAKTGIRRVQRSDRSQAAAAAAAAENTRRRIVGFHDPSLTTEAARQMYRPL